MSLTVTLDPQAEQFVKACLETGRYRSPEEIVSHALETLAQKEPPAPEQKRTTAEAVAHIRESRKGVTLGGLKIKDLIHEGHKY